MAPLTYTAQVSGGGGGVVGEVVQPKHWEEEERWEAHCREVPPDQTRPKFGHQTKPDYKKTCYARTNNRTVPYHETSECFTKPQQILPLAIYINKVGHTF